MKFQFNNKVEFYITNVCNLTCNNCNRFNNHNFRGFQRWSDFADTYQRWSQLIELRSIVLMGGEPLLNPTVKDWIAGLVNTFNCDVQILTNGLHLNRVPDLYDTVRPFAQSLKNFVHFQISLHNQKHFDFLQSQVRTFLRGPIKEWGTYFDRAAPPYHRDYRAFYTAQDVNDVQINMHIDNAFQTAAIQSTPDGKFTVHNSDALAAHANCGFVRHKSYHFIKGKIYKCGPVALLPEFDEQMPLEINDDQRRMMHSYQPFTVEQVEQQGVDILTSIDNPIPQCQFCPVQASSETIWPELKSGKIIQIQAV